MTRTRLILLAIVAATALTACETAKGVGRDITRAADAVDRAL
ncbi:entericidin, EcnA/B family [Tateyamaria sp. syn59]|nr:entericidin, EcnA/B family [Tateyamaria sp. syn59]